MNRLQISGLFLGGATIACDHLIQELPHWLAVMLFSTAVILVLAGMIISRRTVSGGK